MFLNNRTRHSICFALPRNSYRSTLITRYSFPLMDSYEVLEAIQQVMAKVANNDIESVISYMREKANTDDKEFGFYNDKLIS